jgi:hypothetical protein
MILERLYKRKKEFYWSKSLDGSLVVGGYINGNFLGQINFYLSEDKIEVKGSWPPDSNINISYETGSSQYELNKFLIGEIESYLRFPETELQQELNRDKLIRNLFEYLSGSNHSDTKRNKF